jgi:hypothetical protein
MMMATGAVSTLFPIDGDSSTRWFSAHSCVVHEAERVSVYVGGSLIGAYEPGDRGTRNVILVGLARDPRAHLGRMAAAFDMVPETLRLVRAQAEAEGLDAVLHRAPGGSETKLTPSIRRKLETMFEEGLSISKAHARIAKRHDISRTLVANVRAQWRAAEASATAPAIASGGNAVTTLPLPSVKAPTAVETAADPAVSSTPTATAMDKVDTTSPEPEPPEPEVVEATADTRCPSPAGGPRGSDEEGVGAEMFVAERSPTGGAVVQHVGTWILIAAIGRLGVYAAADKLRGRRVDGGLLRIAIDATIAALAIGQRCIEGVRRLATPSAPMLLRADHAPSASWVRRILGRFARASGGPLLHFHLTGELARSAADAKEHDATVFYVDNHLRPYTGKQVVRKGWRMQDKRVRPGTTDYYIHDEDGRAVGRLPVAQHDSLTQWLSPVSLLLRMALGDDERILLAFDRAGAFPVQMAELRDAGFAFVTYERRPYPLLAKTAFEHELEVNEEAVRFTESRINLGKGRGRVRRISVLHDDGRQVNLLAVSEEPAERLIGVMAGRWCQENAFKHGVERWGINQLDGRTTDPYPSDTIIPNPARRRLDRALRIARVREGDARTALAKLDDGDPRREKWERQLKEASAAQAELLALRPSVPTYAALADTELKDKLVKHELEYKMTVDALRIACANVEADLALDLAPRLIRPREAKRVLANVFAAPGRVRVGKRTISISLHPAGTTNELNAIRDWLADLNRQNLVLPADPLRRRLRFQSP